MKLESTIAIHEFLTSHQEFSECILQDVVWRRFGTEVDLVFNYIWTEAGEIRPDIEIPRRILMRLHVVQELHLWNMLTDEMALNPSELDWGLAEVARLFLVEYDNQITRYDSSPLPWHHLRCAWEGGRHLDVIFAYMELASDVLDS